MHNLCRKSPQMEHGSFKGTPDPCGGPALGTWEGDVTCVLESPSYRGSSEPVTGAPPVSLRTWNTYSIIPTVHPQKGGRASLQTTLDLPPRECWSRCCPRSRCSECYLLPPLWGPLWGTWEGPGAGELEGRRAETTRSHRGTTGQTEQHKRQKQLLPPLAPPASPQE